MLDRLELLIGDNIINIQNKTVLIIGVGGVGGYAVETLVRSGIEHLILVDNDKVEISNFNRQLIASNATINQYKVDAFEKRIQDINPKCKITKIKEFITTNNVYLLFDYKIDYLIDACDTITTKEHIIELCLKHNIKFISCMGTGNKLDPTQLKIMDLRDTKVDPIAKKLRKYVKDKQLVGSIPVVCSSEDKKQNGVTTIPSNAFVPAIAGILCTSYVINDILK